MTSPHAYFELSFVFSVLFFSQPYVGSRVTKLRCFAEGVASVWFNCDWFYVCDQNGMPPQFVVCPPLHTFDLGSMRCQSVKNVQELTLDDGEHPSIGSAGQRRFPCKPFDGTDEKYWFQILKFEGDGTNTAVGVEGKGGKSRVSVPAEWFRPSQDHKRSFPGLPDTYYPSQDFGGVHPANQEWWQPNQDFGGVHPSNQEWWQPNQDFGGGRPSNQEWWQPNQDFGGGRPSNQEWWQPNQDFGGGEGEEAAWGHESVDPPSAQGDEAYWGHEAVNRPSGGGEEWRWESESELQPWEQLSLQARPTTEHLESGEGEEAGWGHETENPPREPPAFPPRSTTEHLESVDSDEIGEVAKRRR